MSEPIPESIPTSADRRSHRPTKKRALHTPSDQQSANVDALFANPDREIAIPSAISADARSRLAAPPEIVANVQGSSAGAGSGEFHVYKASRRREYERLRVMDEAVEKEEKDQAWRKQQEEREKADEAKLSKNQAKRAKMKARKEKAKGGAKDGMEVEGGAGENGVKKRLGPAKGVVSNGAGEQDGGLEGSAATNGDMNAGGPPVEEGGGITFHDDD